MNNTPGNSVVDGGALIMMFATFTQYLPSAAAGLSALWFGVRIIESRTVQKLLGKYAWVKRSDAVADKEDAQL